MGTVLLVNGLLVHDSGKTWFSISLAKHLVNDGFRVGMYKPVAGHNAWTQYHTVVRSKELKLLLGADVLAYLDLGLVKIEELPTTNPVDLLMTPLDVITYLDSKMFHKYFTDSLNQFKQLVLARTTLCGQNSFNHFAIRENIKHSTKPLLNDLIELSTILKARDIAIDDIINTLRSQWIEENLNVCLKRICEDSDVVIIESFNDAFTPYPSLLEYVDQVIVVSQGRAILFDDMSRVRRLVRERLATLGDEGLKSANIVGDLNPSAIIDIPPSLNIMSVRGINWKPVINTLRR
ncbi:MAG: hypothetical protein QXY36_03445 [Sulfolobales archaeon]